MRVREREKELEVKRERWRKVEIGRERDGDRFMCVHVNISVIWQQGLMEQRH